VWELTAGRRARIVDHAKVAVEKYARAVRLGQEASGGIGGVAHGVETLRFGLVDAQFRRDRRDVTAVDFDGEFATAVRAGGAVDLRPNFTGNDVERTVADVMRAEVATEGGVLILP
jgi:hypothetical protein